MSHIPSEEAMQAAAMKLYGTADLHAISGTEIHTLVAEARSIEAEQSRTPKADQPFDPSSIKADPVQVDDFVLSVNLMTREGNVTREQAIEAMARGAQPNASALAAERARLQSQADAEAQRQWRASPEGRTYAAREALAAQQERAELVQGARALLEQSGQYGSVDDMSDVELLEAAGIERSPAALAREEDERLATSLEANLEASRRPRQIGGQS